MGKFPARPSKKNQGKGGSPLDSRAPTRAGSFPSPRRKHVMPQNVSRCRECGAETEHVALWDGKAVALCPDCATEIRGNEVRP